MPRQPKTPDKFPNCSKFEIREYFQELIKCLPGCEMVNREGKGWYVTYPGDNINHRHYINDEPEHIREHILQLMRYAVQNKAMLAKRSRIAKAQTELVSSLTPRQIFLLKKMSLERITIMPGITIGGPY